MHRPKMDKEQEVVSQFCVVGLGRFLKLFQNGLESSYSVNLNRQKFCWAYGVSRNWFCFPCFGTSKIWYKTFWNRSTTEKRYHCQTVLIIKASDAIMTIWIPLWIIFWKLLDQSTNRKSPSSWDFFKIWVKAKIHFWWNWSQNWKHGQHSIPQFVFFVSIKHWWIL